MVSWKRKPCTILAPRSDEEVPRRAIPPPAWCHTEKRSSGPGDFTQRRPWSLQAWIEKVVPGVPSPEGRRPPGGKVGWIGQRAFLRESDLFEADLDSAVSFDMEQ